MIVGKLTENNLALASSPKEANLDIMGMIVKELSLEQKKERKLSHGILVIEVDPSGLAASQDIQQGDVITYIGNIKIRNNRDLTNALEKAKEESKFAMIGIVRNGFQTFRSLKLTK